MSSLKQRINDDIKSAMRSKEADRLTTLRMITAAIKQREVDERIQLDDTQVLAVLDKLCRQHRDSIQQYEAGGRKDLVGKETSELNIVQSYLPQQLTDDELKALIQAAVNKTGAATIKDMGKVMGVLKPEIQGRTDMTKASILVKSMLA
jgi:uncharacterized protein YqeY